MKKIMILNFSSRNNGNCASVAGAIEKIYNRTNVRIVRVCEHFRPCSDCDYECLRDGEKCPAADHDSDSVMEAICDSDITFFVIPNYCGVPCANYYAFNERSVGWFNGERNKLDRFMAAEKRFVFISNSMSEAFKGVIEQQCAGRSDVLQLASRKYSRRSIDGDILSSKEALEALEHFVRGS